MRRRIFLEVALAIAATVTTIAAESIGGAGAAKAARSVHLQWNAGEVHAFYLEMTVEQSTGGSYFMACGWTGGYFGLQELRDGKKVAIFSVWDPTKGDDPNAVTPEQRVELLHQGEGVRIKRFGGEGTGGQAMTDFAWHVGETVRFLVRAEAQGEKTTYSGWIFDPAASAWRHLVAFRTRTGGKLLRGLYSFVEDFRRDTRSADEVRHARFGGGWVQSKADAWTPLTQARFTASRAAWEARDTINAGPSGHEFFLATGGKTTRHQDLNATLSLEPPPRVRPSDLP